MNSAARHFGNEIKRNSAHRLYFLLMRPSHCAICLLCCRSLP